MKKKRIWKMIVRKHNKLVQGEFTLAVSRLKKTKAKSSPNHHLRASNAGYKFDAANL